MFRQWLELNTITHFFKGLKNIYMEARFWKPSITSQYSLCPIPYHMDTYRGCSFNCSYCFARDFSMFHRRNKTGKEKEFTYLVGNRPDLLKKWIDKIPPYFKKSETEPPAILISFNTSLKSSRQSQ